MTARVLCLSHPQVAIDPAVPEWPWSEVGRARVERFATNSVLAARRIML